MSNQLKYKIWHQVRIYRQVSNQVINQVYSQIWNQVSQVRDEVWIQLVEKIGEDHE